MIIFIAKNSTLRALSTGVSPDAFGIVNGWSRRRTDFTQDGCCSKTTSWERSFASVSASIIAGHPRGSPLSMSRLKALTR